MARYGPDDVIVSWGGTVVPDVTVIGDIPKEAILEEITPVGSSWETHAPVGVSRAGPVTLEAPYSDDAGNLQALIAATGVGGTATLLLTFGGTKTLSVSCIVRSIGRNIARGALTRFSAVLQPTGTVTEA